MQVGLPKGHLKENIIRILSESGITFTFKNDRDYRPVCNLSWIEAKMFRAGAIPQLVSLGKVDMGFCGLDLVREKDYENVCVIYDLIINHTNIFIIFFPNQIQSAKSHIDFSQRYKLGNCSGPKHFSFNPGQIANRAIITIIFKGKSNSAF